MSDQKKDREIQEISPVDSDESSKVQDSEMVFPNVIQDILKASANKQVENVVDGNETVVTITNSNKAPEMLQTEECLLESLMPHESVQAPVNELPRNSEEKEDVTSAAPSQPSKRRRRSSTGGISINTEAAAEVADDGGLRRSSRIKDRDDADNASDWYSDPYLFKTRPLYMEKKRDAYAYLGEDSEYEDDE